MASAIDGYDGYSTTYTDGNTYFIVTADNPKAGETIAVRMQEYDAEINYAEHTHVPVTDPAVPATETDTGLTVKSAVRFWLLRMRSRLCPDRHPDSLIIRIRHSLQIRQMDPTEHPHSRQQSAQRQAIQMHCISMLLWRWQAARQWVLWSEEELHADKHAVIETE